MGGDVSIRTFVGGGPSAKRLRTYLAAEIGSILEGGGRLDVVRSADGRVIAAAAWEQPGYRESALQTLRYGPAMLKAVRWNGLRNWLALRPEFLRFRPREPYWHLVRLGTDFQFRRSGLGTALLQYRLSQLDDAGEAAHLEASSDDSARLYERVGFVAVGEIQLRAHTRILAMSRPQSGGAASRRP